MVATDRTREIFADSRDVYQSALERLDAGDIRDAAEKAWCATKRATDALVVSRGKPEPERSPATSRELKDLARLDPTVRPLVPRYYLAQGALHGDCFYLGFCEPLEDTEELIRGTIGYIEDAERLAR